LNQIDIIAINLVCLILGLDLLEPNGIAGTILI